MNGIAVREAEVVDVLAELPVQRALLAHAEQVRLIEADEAADARALPHRRAEVHVPGALLLHVEDDVDVALVVRRLRVRRGKRRLEEAQVADALVAAHQRVAAEHVARHDEDLVPDARLRRDVVAEDLDAVHDRRRLLVDLPPQIHGRHGVGADFDRARRPGARWRRCSPRWRTPRRRAAWHRPTRAWSKYVASSPPRPARSTPFTAPLSVAALVAERIEPREVLAREVLAARSPRSVPIR